jgi:hypothetical protein
MKAVRITALAVALVAAGGLFVPASHAAAVLPQAAPAVATRSVSVDVDGDGAADAVTIEQSAPHTFAVNVVTAAGRSAVLSVTSRIADDWGIEPWYGAAQLDGAKGYELLLLTSGGDGLMFRVLTWRSGSLVAERAPRSLIKGSYDWYLADLGWARFGYRFSTEHHKRYVRDVELYTSGRYFKGTIVTSVWKAGAWHALTSKRVKLTTAQAKRYSWLAGVKLVARP